MFDFMHSPRFSIRADVSATGNNILTILIPCFISFHASYVYCKFRGFIRSRKWLFLIHDLSSQHFSKAS